MDTTKLGYVFLDLWFLDLGSGLSGFQLFLGVQGFSFFCQTPIISK